MAFQQESIYLNLQKDIHSISYGNVTDQDNDTKSKGKFSKTNEVVKEENLAYNNILFFQEKDIVLRDIQNVTKYFIKTVQNKNPFTIPFQDIVTRINMILHKYIEKPSLLDNIVEPVLDNIVQCLRVFLQDYFKKYQKTNELPKILPQLDKIVSIVVILIQVRGIKNIQKYLGHDTSDFEPLLFFLISSDQRVFWETKNFLFIWLSVVLFIPFEFNRLDSKIIPQYYAQNYKTEEYQKIELLIIDYCKRSLRSTSRIGDSIGKCIAVIFRRPDMSNLEYFKELIFWGIEQLHNCLDLNENLFYGLNIYKILNQMIKNIRRDFVIAIHKELFEKIVKLDISIQQIQIDLELKEPANLNQQRLKLILNILDKILLTSSRRRIYKTIKKNLQDQLEIDQLVPMISNCSEIKNNDREIEAEQKSQINTDIHNLEFINMIEKSIDFFFDGLQNKNSEVRYCSAKALAQIAFKLPENLSDELLATILGFYQNADEYMAHSICLVIGEFCRKRILTPIFLPQVFKILNNSLMFEDIEGLSSSGSIVRDAACFISWSLAKFYEKETLAPFVDELSGNLLLAALLDREGMCRRAAAASFQENVGRQGYFPHGIEIISEMDYFTVGIRQNSFLNISPFVANFSEYTNTFLDHLSQVKIYHFDKPTRIISAKTLSLIALLNPNHVIQNILPQLINKAQKGTLFERHGAIYSIGYILITFSGESEKLMKQIEEENNIFLHSLQINEKKLLLPGQYMQEFKDKFEKLKVQNIINTITQDLVEQICEIPNYITKNGLLKGMGGEIQRIALAELIKGISYAKLDLNDNQIDIFFEFVLSALNTTIDEIHDHINIALSEFGKVYLSKNPEKYVKYLQTFIKKIQNVMIKDIKKSFCKGISSFPIELILQQKQQVIDILKLNCQKLKKIAMNDPEIRKFCVESLGIILQKILKHNKDKESFDQVFKIYLKTIQDFTIDKRGDIGLIIRQQTIDSVYDILKTISENYSNEEFQEFYNETIIINELGWIISLLAEPNNKLRLKAGYIIQMIVNDIYEKFPDFQGKQKIYEIFNIQNLREKFQQFQELFFKKYDVSLMDNKKYLQYEENEKFVYFWNIPKCVYTLIFPIVEIPRFSGNFLRGFLFSLNSQSEEISKEAFEAIKNFLENNPSLQPMILENIFKIFIKNKKKEKFFEACLNAISMLLKLELEEFDNKEIFIKLIDECYESCKTTKSLKKLKLSSQVITFLLEKIDLDKKQFLEKYKEILELFMYSEYPIVCKEFFENFYIFLIGTGDLLFEEKDIDEMTEIISNIDVSQQGVQFQQLFLTVWKEIIEKFKQLFINQLT